MGCNFYMRCVEIMALLVLENSTECYTKNDMQGYAEYIAERMPVYTTYSISDDSIDLACETFPTIFVYNYTNKSFTSGKHFPNPRYFFDSYNEDILNLVKRLTKNYVNNLMQKDRNKRAKKKLLGVE